MPVPRHKFGPLTYSCSWLQCRIKVIFNGTSKVPSCVSIYSFNSHCTRITTQHSCKVSVLCVCKPRSMSREAECTSFLPTSRKLHRCFDKSFCSQNKLYELVDQSLRPATSPGKYPFELLETKSMELRYSTAWLCWDTSFSRNTITSRRTRDTCRTSRGNHGTIRVRYWWAEQRQCERTLY